LWVVWNPALYIEPWDGTFGNWGFKIQRKGMAHSGSMKKKAILNEGVVEGLKKTKEKELLKMTPK